MALEDGSLDSDEFKDHTRVGILEMERVIIEEKKF